MRGQRGQPARPGKGPGLFLSWKDSPASLKQYLSQGLLIPPAAADHVNPGLCEPAACPGATNQQACEQAGVIPSQPSSPRLPEPGRATVQRSGQQDSILGRTQSALWPVFSTGFRDPLCEAQEAPTTGRLSSGASVSLSLQGERSYLGTKGTLKKCICFGGEMSKYSKSAEDRVWSEEKPG